jgi:predicted outer membrane protein
MCDLDSQGKSFDKKSRNKEINHSKSFNNLLKASQLNLAAEQREIQANGNFENSSLQGHLNEFKRSKGSFTPKGYKLNKVSSKEYNSSIHQ